MIQQTLQLFDTFPILEVPEDQIWEQYQEEYSVASSLPQETLLTETQQLFHSDGSEAELVTLIQKAIDVIQDLCNQTN